MSEHTEDSPRRFASGACETGTGHLPDPRLHPNLDPAAFVFRPGSLEIVELNQSARRLGYSLAELLGRPVSDLFSPEDRAAFRAWVVDAGKHGKLAAGPMRLLKPDGDLLEVEISLAALEYEDKPAWYLVAHDVTGEARAARELRQQEEEARRRQQEFVEAFAHAPVGMALTTLHGDLQYANDAYCALVGLRREDLIGRNFLSLTAEEDVARNRRALEQLVAGEIPSFHVEKRYRRADGALIWVRASAAVRHDAAGRPLQVVGLVEDITERKRAEAARDEALRDAEDERRRLEAVLDALPAGVAIADAMGRVMRFNQELLRIWGHPPIPRHAGEYAQWRGWWADSGEPLAPEEWAMARALATGERVPGDVVDIEKFDGSGRATIINAAAPIRNGEGRIVGGVVAELDITAQKRAEDALRRAEEFLSFALATAGIGAWDLDLTDYTAHRSAQHDEIFGYPEPLPRWTYQDFLAHVIPEDRDAVDASFRQAVAQRTDWRFECRIRRRDGEVRWIWAAARHRREENGRARLAGIVQDITERKRADAALRESEERFRILADAMPQLVWTAEPDGRVDYYNCRAAELSGIERHADGSWKWAPVVHPDDVARTLDAWNAALARGEPYQVEHRVKRADGSFRWYLSRGVPARDAQGRIVKWYGTATDIQEQKEAQHALREADRRKDEFIATLAHELRNPLAPLMSGLEIIKRAGDDPERMAATGAMMERQMRHLVRLVDDLLDLSRITTGKLILHKDRIELGQVLQAAVEATERLFRAYGHRLTLSFPAVPLWLVGDFTRLTQLFSNLLTNAAKYTDLGGEVRLSYAREDDRAVIRVRDNGVGIPADTLESIFGMFAQLHHAGGASAEGLGVGLHLARRLAEMHGGTLHAQSAGPGRGSEFILSLPLAPQRAPRRATTPFAELRERLRVLVVDDNQDARDTLAALLELMGHDVRTAADGASGLALAESFRPRVLLLDLGMPGMDGYETARRLRGQEWGRDVFVTALSGWGQEEDRRRTRAAGFDHHLLKPVDAAGLRELFARLPRR